MNPKDDVRDNSVLLSAQAKQWVRENRKKLIAEFCNPDVYPTSDHPVTVFMAGTPGAGKTEFSVTLIETFGGNFVRIDADEIRERMRPFGYNGLNAEIFQEAANKAVNQLFDFANRKGGQNVLLDGTFAYGDWRGNVQRSLNNGRRVEIYYLHQDPSVAWQFVIKRQAESGRVVPLEVFIKSYQASIDNVQKAIEVFGVDITVYFAKNNYTKTVEYIAVDVDDIEKLIGKRYTETDLKELLHA